VNPSGRLPVSIPRDPGAQPSTYLASKLARRNDVSNIDPTPAYPFGHGLGYAPTVWADAAASAIEMSTAGSVTVSIHVGNAGDRDGVEVVQLYLHDPVASVVRPVQRLIGFRKVRLTPGESVRLSVRVSAELASFTGADLKRIVEPGDLVLGFGRSSADIPLTHTVAVTGATRVLGVNRALHPVWR